MNPMNLLRQYIMKGITPKGILNRLNINNPILNNVITMAQNGNSQGVEEFARNICKQRGIDFDTEYSKFKESLK